MLVRILVAAALAAGIPRPAPAADALTGDLRAPVAAPVPHSDTTLGDVRVDNYHWLRQDAALWREGKADPKVREYLEAENQYTQGVMRHTEGLQQALYDEMVSRLKETDLTVPERLGSSYYYTRTEKGRNYRFHCRRKGSPEGPEEVLLDENALAEGHEHLGIGAYELSDDETLLAFGTDLTGAEIYTVHVKDLRTGQALSDQIQGAGDGLAWAADGRSFFYVTMDSAQRPYRLYRHALGTAQAKDVLVHEETDPLYNLEVQRSRSRRFIYVTLSSFNATEVRYLPAERPLEALRVLAPRTKDIEYSVEDSGERFFIVTNEDAVNFKIMTAPIADPAKAGWKTFLGHRKHVLVDAVDAFKDFLVVYEREKALRTMQVFDLATGVAHAVEFPEPVYTYRAAVNPEFDTHKLRFTYTSMVTPATVIDYDMGTRAREVKKVQEIPGGYDPSLYATERAWAKAPDGTRVPISLLYRKPLVRDGKRPLLLYGYGSYGIPIDPSFSTGVLSLVDRGVVYGIAHIRGGNEMGRAWYDQGKLLAKKNTFTDFIACAEGLVHDKFTSPDRLAIRGGSAGGLLVGAVLNMRPDLFKAAVADVPFVDIINTMMDASIPLTTQEWEQWGDPHMEPFYSYMKSYSPYDNVKAQAYPNLLVTAGLNDPRVPYWEPAKWTAKLRALKTDSNRLLLRTNMGTGHGGASGRYDAIRENALRYAFVLDVLGLADARPAAAGAAAPKP